MNTDVRRSTVQNLPVCLLFTKVNPSKCFHNFIVHQRVEGCGPTISHNGTKHEYEHEYMYMSKVDRKHVIR